MHPVLGRGQLLITRHRNLPVLDERLLRKQVRSGEMIKVGNGAFVRSDVWKALRFEDRTRLAVAAAWDARRSGLVFSHRSAGALWGVPSIAVGDSLVHVRTSVAAGTRTEHGFRKHAVARPDLHVVELQGMAVTSLPRTIVDIALTESFPSAVVAVDWALKEHTDRTTLLTTLDELAPRQGAARASRAIRFGDGASGSAGESRSRADVELSGLPAPLLQHRFFDGAGFVGQVDFYWPQFAVIGEFDGAIKYSDAGMLDGRQPYDVLIAEKQREDRLRDLGFRVVRWMWDVFDVRGTLADRLIAAGVRRR